ncbi:MAG TPA: 50S ribosomal protein L15 [Thermoflexia bacterium]|nr:MAG: 50S ribosomal protein L15 [Chloroflexota bacterium]HEY67878.1 50S ribosomal protein L15 [Thermoflexia bacterium]
MKLHELRPAEGAVKRRKRVGRGIAAGQGKTAGRGTKGQKARSGGGVRPYFEGGQLPLVRKLPFARGVGFRDPWRVRFTPVNLERLAVFQEGAEVTPEALAEAGIIKRADELVVILGHGELNHPLTVKAHRFSASARAKIEAAGGSVEELPWRRGGYRTR